MTLQDLHHRLTEHFEALRASRDAVDPTLPVFALEHGLSIPEIEELQGLVKESVFAGRWRSSSWLPLVIYAAELGYEYEGDEYWPTFEERTPRWSWQGDAARQYVRSRFSEFAAQFRGAQPRGAWAEWFRIIAWPITHAILPTDLQRQLARILYDYRYALNAAILESPGELGKRLASRSYGTSSRFYNFAQNTELLGQVAAALLTGDDDNSPYILGATLKRIVSDLSKEREAARFLRGAKRVASEVRTRGFMPAKAPTTGTRDVQKQSLSLTDPNILLERGPRGWTAMIELPDLTTLGERYPAFHDELRHLRSTVAGVDGRLATGRLLFPNQRLTLDYWPDPAAPLIQADQGSPRLNALLAESCMLTPGPKWLFRSTDSTTAVQVRGLFVRPGNQCVLLSKEWPGELPDWIRRTECCTRGVYAFVVIVPGVISDEEFELLERMSISVVAEVEVRPVAVLPAKWDGEGVAEWVAGDDPIIAISSQRAVREANIKVNGIPHAIDWIGSETYVRLSSLEVGEHQVDVLLKPPEGERAIAEGRLLVGIRPPHPWTASGSGREAMTIVPSPGRPTLEELWDGRGTLAIDGPAGAEVKVRVVLGTRSIRAIADTTVSGALPIDDAAWARVFASARSSPPLQRSYDHADLAFVTVSHSSIGSVSIQCEREFTALRWSLGEDHEGPFARLIDNTDAAATRVEAYSFRSPSAKFTLELDDLGVARHADGGLFRALSNSLSSGVVLPPMVRDLHDLRSTVLTEPEVEFGPKNEARVREAIGIARIWREAKLPANPFAATSWLHVLRAIARALTGLMAGPNWINKERQVLEADSSALHGLTTELGRHGGYQAVIAGALAEQLPHLATAQLSERVSRFAEILAATAGQAGVDTVDLSLAEFLLQLASDPGVMSRVNDDELSYYINLVIVSPVLLRAARCVVIGTHLAQSEDSISVFRGWRWP